MKTPLVLALALGACGQVHSLADAGAGDSPATGADAGSADASPDAPTDVAVTVLGPAGSRAPSAGVPVVFTRADGATAALVTSGVDGTAHAALPEGGSVTAVWPEAGNRYVVETITGTRPGDALTLVGDGADLTEVGHYTVTWPARAGTSTFFAYVGCGPSFAEPTATSATVPIYAACKRDTMTVAVAAFDSSGALLGYLEKRGVAYQDGGRTDLTGPWQNPQTFTASVSGLSSALEGGVDIDRSTDDTFGFDASASGAIAGATTSLSVGAPSSSRRAWVRTTLLAAHATGNSTQVIAQPIDGQSFTYALDAGAHLLPWVDLATFDPATATITIPHTGSGTPDGAAVTVELSRTVNGVFTDIRWTVIAAGVDRPLALPHLPIEVGDVDPRAGDAVGDGEVVLLDADTLAGYDAVRADLFGAIAQTTSGRSTAQLVRVSRAQQSE